MIQNVIKTSLPGILKIERSVFKDHRGFYSEAYNEQEYRQHGIDTKFVAVDYSLSRRGVLRGLHGDTKTWKLISCAFGEIYFVVLNYDPNSKFFGKWESFKLSDENGLQILVPPLYGNGHLAISDKIVFHYLQSEYYYGQENQFVIAWNDSKFNISWPIENPILSKRDSGLGA